jgi:hypothetical protein
MITFPPNDPPAESYQNTFAQPPVDVLRWWVPGYPIMVGGSVVSDEDWDHLVSAYGITHCLSLDARGRRFIVPNRTGAFDAPDNGLVIAASLLKVACGYAREVLNAGGKLYVQDLMGAARGSAFAYAILRSVYGLSHDDGLVAVNKGMPHSASYHWGYNDAARAHIGSVDLWIDEGGLGA